MNYFHNRSIQGFLWGVTLLVAVVGLSTWLWLYQQTNLKSLKNGIDKIKIPKAAHIPKKQLNAQITILQQDIDALKIDDASKIRLNLQITVLKQQFDSLPEEIMTPKERLTLEKDLLFLKKDFTNAENAIINTILQGIGGLFFFLTVVISWQNYQISQDKQITERFSKAVEQLGSKEIEVCLGGIYSLERIAKDSPEDCWTIMEVLTSFVQKSSPLHPIDSVNEEQMEEYEEMELPPVTIDVQAALTVIGRVNIKDDSNNNNKLVLSQTNLKKADLRKANFQYADLSGSNLRWTDLEEANLREADLQGANLFGANLKNADLRKAKLAGTKLVGAEFQDAQLEGTKLEGADLTGAKGLPENLMREL